MIDPVAARAITYICAAVFAIVGAILIGLGQSHQGTQLISAALTLIGVGMVVGGGGMAAAAHSGPTDSDPDKDAAKDKNKAKDH